MRALIATAGLLGFALVATAAIGAHAVLADIRAADPASPLLRQWDQAILFGLLHTVATLVCAALLPSRVRAAGGWLFIVGAALFSGVQLARIAGLPPPGMLVPVGGVSLMAGWLALAVSAFLKRD